MAQAGAGSGAGGRRLAQAGAGIGAGQRRHTSWIRHILLVDFESHGRERYEALLDADVVSGHGRGVWRGAARPKLDNCGFVWLCPSGAGQARGRRGAGAGQARGRCGAGAGQARGRRDAGATQARGRRDAGATQARRRDGAGTAQAAQAGAGRRRTAPQTGAGTGAGGDLPPARVLAFRRIRPAIPVANALIRGRHARVIFRTDGHLPQAVAPGPHPRPLPCAAMWIKICIYHAPAGLPRESRVLYLVRLATGA